MPEPRRFLDCDGDTWEEYAPGELRCVASARENAWYIGMTDSIEDVVHSHGPLTEILPDVPNFRALLADVLDDMAASVDFLDSYDDDCATRETSYRMKGIFANKARELREAVAGGESG